MLEFNPHERLVWLIAGTAGLFALLFLCRAIHCMRMALIKRAAQTFFGIADLDRFQVRKMGKRGSRYYKEDGANTLQLSLPHWKYPAEDGSRDKKRHLNRIVWEESALWLHAGRRVYVVTAKDPWDMLYLVHTLRESGLDIDACQQELEKQERIENERGPCDKYIQELVERTENQSTFVDLCRRRLVIRGVCVADAPGHKSGVDLFVQRGGRPAAVWCQFVQREHLTSLSEVKAFREAAAELFMDSCVLITTGRITVAAAGFARENDMQLICDEELVQLLEENRAVPPGRSYLRWELDEADLKRLVPEDLLCEIYR